MSIGNWLGKVKGFTETEQGRSAYLITIIILTAAFSFGLGRLSKVEIQSQPQVVIEGGVLEISRESASDTIQKSVSQGQGNYMASKIGKRYYPAGCSAAKNLKPENLIYFQTAAAAEAAGYTPSASC